MFLKPYEEDPEITEARDKAKSRVNTIVFDEALAKQAEIAAKPDPVNHPSHYQSASGLEVIDVIEAFTADLPGNEAVCVGNALKYLCRYCKKGMPLEDLKKAKWYVERAIMNVEEKSWKL